VSGTTIRRKRDRAILSVLLYHGLRREEICSSRSGTSMHGAGCCTCGCTAKAVRCGTCHCILGRRSSSPTTSLYPSMRLLWIT
jgi:hypothetical protein